MYVILVIFLVNRIISAQDSSDETKYIDLLPDKEKEEFLERIARRIFDGVQTKDNRGGVSEEISDSQLNEHDAFVKQILKEESSNLRKSGVIEDKKSDDNYKKDEDKLVKESFEKKDIHETVDGAELVDLTLRDGKRNKRNSFAKTNEDSKIIHVSVGNEEMKAPSKEDYQSNADLMQDKSGLKAEDIQIKFFKRNSAKTKNVLEVTTQNHYQLTQMIDFDNEDETAKSNSKETIAVPEDTVDGSLKDKNKTPETKEEVVNEDENIRNIINENTVNNNFGSTKSYYESKEKEETGSLEDKSGAPETVKNTTVNESASLDLKPTVVPTEKISNEKNSTEEHININLNARSLSYTVGVTLESNEELDKKESTIDYSKNDGKINGYTTVAVETIRDLEPGINHSKEITKGLEKLNYNKTTTDEITTRNTNNEHITEKNTEVGSTTMKTKGLTITPLTTETEKTVEKESNIKDLNADNEDNFNQLKNQDKNYQKEVSSIELIGSEVYENMQKSKSKNTSTKRNDKNTEIKDIKNEKVKQDTKPDKNSYNLANDMIKVLRTEIKSESYSDDNNLNGLTALYEATKPKEYIMYEVPAAKQPLIQKDQLDMTNKENPYYVPIYNYSPNNAYFNPHNRLGPNADDDEDETILNRSIENKNDDLNENEKEDISFDYDSYGDATNVGLDSVRKEQTKQGAASNESKRKRHKDKAALKGAMESLIKTLKDYKNPRKFRFGSSQPKHNKVSPYKFNMPMVVHYPKFTDIILNPNDYLDMDYYYGRSLKTPSIRSRCEIDRNDKKFPDSTEEDHPLNNMHAGNNLKSHMRSVRQLLYRQKHFGYVPPPNDTEPIKNEKEALRSESNANNDYSKYVDDKNIAMDYFFGRMSNELDTEMRTKEIPYSKNPNKGRFFHKNLKIPNDQKYRYSVNNENKADRNKVPKGLFSWYKGVTSGHNDKEYARYKPKLRAKKKKENATDYATIKKILSIANEDDLLLTLDKLLKLNLTARTNDEVDLEPYVTVLEDLVQSDAKGLKQYDWLTTTVDIQSALAKLMDMTELHSNITISQPDLQLLKYAIYLHKSTKKMVTTQFRKNRLLPRNKKKRKGIITESGLLNRHWLFRMAHKHDTKIMEEDVNNFCEFLDELQYYLYDLHTSIKQIATITKYNSQRWFENVKELYLNNKRKNLLEVLLHITTTRLLDLVEDSAKNGAEEDFLTYMMKNEKVVERTKEEFAFALKIIDELKMIE